MRYLLIIILATLLSSTSLLAQDQVENERLLARFSAKELAQMRIDEPEMIAYWSYYADARCMQVPAPAENLSITIAEVEFDLEEANYLLLDLAPYHEKGGQLRVKGTAVLLVIKPESMFLRELNGE